MDAFSSKSLFLFLICLTFSLLISSATNFTQSQPNIPIPFPSPPSIPSSILNACNALASSDRLSMSLTLQLVAPDLDLRSPPYLTVFAPPNSAFLESGQPSWATLSLHLSRLVVSDNLLRKTSIVPSLTPNIPLIIDSYTVNGVNVTPSPIFDDGRVVVYGIDRFLDHDFVANYTPANDYKCFTGLQGIKEGSFFENAVGLLESRGYSIMASILKLQFSPLAYGGREDYVGVTIFAPTDEDFEELSVSNFDYFPIMLKHVVASKVDWIDLSRLGNSTVVSNYEGGSLQFTKDKDSGMVLVNGVEITAPGMYESDGLAIHGIGGIISVPVGEEIFDDQSCVED